MALYFIVWVMKRTVTFFIFYLLLFLPTVAVFAVDSPGKGVVVEKIHPEIVDETTERVCMQFSDYFLPSVRTLEGGKPRIFVDIENVTEWKGAGRIDVGGRMILRVRSHWYDSTRVLRIVLDLVPTRNYYVNQTYIVSGNIFCMEVSIEEP